MKKSLKLFILILTMPIISFSQNISRETKNDSIVSVNTEQLRYSNLIFVEHSKLLEENFILNTLVNNYKLKIDVLEKMDTNKSLQLNSYKELTENYATQVSDLQKSLKKKQNILKTWKIGCFTIGIGALLYILLK